MTRPFGRFKMDARSLKVISPRKWLFIIILSAAAVFALWGATRFWLITVLLTSEQVLHLIDITLIFVTGLAIIMLVSQLIASHVAAYLGPTQSNTIRLLFQVASFSIILLLVFSTAGINLVGTLVGVGFFGIVVGLAAQAVLGNLFSGLMLVASRPFKIGDRIALIAWQYGKFPPSLSHGWLEPSYTGHVKEITLIYTKILTDSNALVTVPNGILTQSLILNLSHDKDGHVGTQFEVPIQVDPDELRKSLNSQLSRMPDFKGEEESFELLEISPSAYLMAISFRVEKQREREMKPFLLKAFRLALMSTYKSNVK
jgi:small-conductance mechanosensitive channel